jgi:hypothetical protein
MKIAQQKDKTMNSKAKPDFYVSLLETLSKQSATIQQEFMNKLDGSDYTREASLPYLFTADIRIRPVSTNAVTKNDINYTMWLIAELKGKLAAQLAHKSMQQAFFNQEAYNRDYHMAIIGALQAEMRTLSLMLADYETTNCISKENNSSIPAKPQTAPNSARVQ